MVLHQNENALLPSHPLRLYLQVALALGHHMQRHTKIVIRKRLKKYRGPHRLDGHSRKDLNLTLGHHLHNPDIPLQTLRGSGGEVHYHLSIHIPHTKSKMTGSLKATEIREGGINSTVPAGVVEGEATVEVQIDDNEDVPAIGLLEGTAWTAIDVRMLDVGEMVRIERHQESEA